MRSARLAAALVTALATGATVPPAGAAVTHGVLTASNTYLAPRQEILAGDSLVHANADSEQHNLVSSDARPDGKPWFESELIGAGETASVPVESVPPGIYSYTCAIHASMLGTLEILALPLDPGEPRATPPPTKIDALTASAAGETVTISGAATFGAQPLLSIGTDPTGDASVPLPMYDLVEAKLGQLDLATGDLTFVFKVADLPFDGSVPEAARYSWDFGIQVPGIDEPIGLQVDGKFTDVLRRQSTRVPAFVLRGNCNVSVNPITCVDIANLDAEFAGADNEVFVDVPRSVLEQQLTAKRPGASIEGTTIVPVSIFEGIGVHPSAYVSAGGTGDTLPEPVEYGFAYRRVRVGVAPPGGTPATMTDAALASDGSFSASLSGLAPGTYDVVAQACFGTNCGTRRVTLSL